jgi:hypothetical protein
MKRSFGGLMIFVCGVLAAGCSQPVRTLMEYGKEQKLQKRFVDARDAKFNLLYEDVKKNRLQPGGMKTRVITRYGAPVLEEGLTLLYRPVTDFFGPTKIYLTFDKDGVLKDIKCEES